MYIRKLIVWKYFFIQSNITNRPFQFSCVQWKTRVQWKSWVEGYSTTLLLFTHFWVYINRLASHTSQGGAKICIFHSSFCFITSTGITTLWLTNWNLTGSIIFSQSRYCMRACTKNWIAYIKFIHTVEITSNVILIHPQLRSMLWASASCQHYTRV